MAAPEPLFSRLMQDPRIQIPFILLLVGFIVYALYLKLTDQDPMERAERELWERLAAEFGGRSKLGAWGTLPRLWVPLLDGKGEGLLAYQETPSYGAAGAHRSENASVDTLFTVELIDAPYRVRVHESGLLDSLTALAGAQDIIIGDGGFDGRFVVKSTKPDWAKGYLSDAEVRRLVMEVYALDRGGRFLLEFDEDGMHLRVGGRVDGYPHIRAFALSCSALFEAAVKARPA